MIAWLYGIGVFAIVAFGLVGILRRRARNKTEWLMREYVHDMQDRMREAEGADREDLAA